eukprot:3096507-Rhodomonas_salina.1
MVRTVDDRMTQVEHLSLELKFGRLRCWHRFPKEAEPHLRREMGAAGVEASRLLLTDKVETIACARALVQSARVVGVRNARVLTRVGVCSLPASNTSE